MTLEELQAMSDEELNRLAAVKVMGWEPAGTEAVSGIPLWLGEDGKYAHYTYDGALDWNPTEDMNDAILLIEVLKKKIMPINMFPVYPTGWHCHVYKAVDLLFIVPSDSLPRAITIASILAKE